MKKAAVLVVLILCAGCATRITFERVSPTRAEITANTKCVAELTTKADGTETWKVDTSQQGLYEKVRAGLVNLVNYLGRALDNVEVNAND